MNSPLRKVGVVALVLFALLFINLNWVQFVKADAYRNSPYNARVQLDEYNKERGAIQADGGSVLAKSVDTGGELRYERRYPFGPEYADVVGYKSVHFGSAGIEYAQNDLLSGKAASLFVNRLTGMLSGRNPAGGNVLLTIQPKVQETAYRDLAGRKGAVVAIDATTGALLSVVSTPSYDPNPLSSNNGATAAAAWQRYQSDPADPMLNRAFQNEYPPGSTFKVIASAAALEKGLKPDTVIPAGPSYTPPQTTHEIHNDLPSICPDPQITLKDALTVSCNTGFARLCVEQLHADAVKTTARDFGFEDTYKTPLPVVASHTGDIPDDATLAGSCIGQQNVRMTVLQEALISAAIANDGVQMTPYLVASTQTPELTTVDQTQPSQLRRPVSPTIAADLRDMMVNVVQNGTGHNARIDGVTVGGKTGTAEHGDNAAEHGWFTGFGIKGDHKIAVAVFLESAGPAGSGQATQIAGDVIAAALGVQR